MFQLPVSRRVPFQRSRRAAAALAALALGPLACADSDPTGPGSVGAFADELAGGLVFESDRDGDLELYAQTADGQTVHRLTTAPGFDESPDVSPDGRWV
ncbi:MAG: TolB family protein, partial [Gemmatimonadota bacterium]